MKVKEGRAKPNNDPKQIAALIRDLGDEDKNKHEPAVKALVEWREAAVGPLIEALKDENPHLRSHAAAALGLIGDKRAIEPLNEVLDNEDEDSEVCLRVTVALGKLGDEETIEYCISGLEDGDSDERSGSAVALGLIGDNRAVKPLIKALNDKDNEVRCYAAAALGEIGDAQALPALEKLEQTSTRLSAAGRKVKEIAGGAIRRIREKNSITART